MRARIMTLSVVTPTVGLAHGIEPLVIAAGEGVALSIAVVLACLPRVMPIGRALVIVLPLLSVAIMHIFPSAGWWLDDVVGPSEGVGALFLGGALPPLVLAVLIYIISRRRKPKNA